MTWSGTANRVFGAFVNNPMLGVTGASGAGLPTGYQGLATDVVKCALYNNTTTPDATAAVASTGYNTGQWVTANEVTGGTDWVAGGRTLAGDAFAFSGSAVTYSANNLTSAATASFTAYGCLVYDSSISGGTVAKQGVCYLDFGGAQTVSAGTFSLIWNAGGIFSVTV